MAVVSKTDGAWELQCNALCCCAIMCKEHQGTTSDEWRALLLHDMSVLLGTILLGSWLLAALTGQPCGPT